MNDQRSRKRARFACRRCHTWKKKCDSDGFSCTNCRKAHTTCEAVDKHSSRYVEMLEGQIAALEEANSRSVLLSEGSQGRDGEFLNRRASVSSPSSAAVEASPSPVSTSPTSSAVTSQQESLIKCAAFISLGPELEPSYLGSTSGVYLASVIQKVVWDQGISIPPLGGSSDTSQKDGDGPVPSVTQLMLPRNLRLRLIDLFIRLVHVRFPALDKSELHQFNDSSPDLFPVSAEGLSRDLQYKRFVLLMVYAIGLQYAQFIDREDMRPLSPAVVCEVAMRELPAMLRKTDTHSVQCLILVIIYLMRSRAGAGIWHMTGLAIRMCVELGIHRKEPLITPSQSYQILARRRIFWTVYALERLICQSLGRPFSLSDRDIDAEFPVDIGDEITDQDIIFEALTSPNSIVTESQPLTSLTFSLHILKLRRTDSKIQQMIYRVDKDKLPPVGELDPILGAIDSWKDSTPRLISPVQQCHVDLVYHKSIRNALIPYLANLPLGSSHCDLCLRSAGSICQLSKRLHQEGSYVHSFIALQTVFVAGLTVIYGLWTGKLVWDMRASEDLQACSTVLFVIAERSPSTKAFRDTFEQLLTTTKQHCDGGHRPSYQGHPATDTLPTPPTLSVMPESDPNAFSRWENMSVDELWKVVYDSTWPPSIRFPELVSDEIDFGDIY